MAKIKIKCDTCGKEFEKYESKIGKNNFCCREHYLIFHSRDVKFYTCEVCGKEFKGDKYNANRFCSRECYDISHGIKNKERICLVCGKIFIANNSERKFCSHECHLKNNHNLYKGENHHNWKGGISKLEDRHDSNDYKQWRKAVYEKDNYKCVKCGSKEKINAHHIKAWKYYPELRYDIHNGITLCEKCHIKIHQKYGYDSTEDMV